MIIKMLIMLFGMMLAFKGLTEFHPKDYILGLILFIISFVELWLTA